MRLLSRRGSLLSVAAAPGTRLGDHQDTHTRAVTVFLGEVAPLRGSVAMLTFRPSFPATGPAQLPASLVALCPRVGRGSGPTSSASETPGRSKDKGAGRIPAAGPGCGSTCSYISPEATPASWLGSETVCVRGHRAGEAGGGHSTRPMVMVVCLPRVLPA